MTKKRRSNKRQGVLAVSARLRAVQALYQIELAEDQPLRVIAQHVESSASRPFDGELFRRIVIGVTRDMAALDVRLIAAIHHGGGLARLEIVLRAILRAAALELGEEPAQRRPIAVVIDAYLQVTHNFFGAGEVGLVNGVLDRLAKSCVDAEAVDG